MLNSKEHKVKTSKKRLWLRATHQAEQGCGLRDAEHTDPGAAPLQPGCSGTTEAQ